MTKKKLITRYEKIIQSNNYLRAHSNIEVDKIYSGTKKKGQYSRKVLPSCDLNSSSDKQVVL
jgi:hypothetical protein